MDNIIPSTGALHSDCDPRTVVIADKAGVPLIKGGAQFLPKDIENQHN